MLYHKWCIIEDTSKIQFYRLQKPFFIYFVGLFFISFFIFLSWQNIVVDCLKQKKSQPKKMLAFQAKIKKYQQQSKKW